MNSAGSCVLTLFSKQYSIATPCQVFFWRYSPSNFQLRCHTRWFACLLNDCILNGADSHVLTLFSMQFYKSMPCQVICFSNDCIINSAGSCVLTLFSKQYSIATPCQVLFWRYFRSNFQLRCHARWLSLCFERLHLVSEAILHIHAMPGDLFVFGMIAPQCRLMCVDTVFEAIFNCDAMQVICGRYFRSNFQVRWHARWCVFWTIASWIVQILMCVDIVLEAI